MMNRSQLTVAIMLFLAQACLGHRSQLTKITRKSASFGTLHSVTLWYEPLDRTKPLPQTKKVFNFSRSQHARILASFTTSTPRAELDATLDAHVREAAAFFAERITAFSEQKKKESPPFTCAFRMNSPIKNIAVTVRLSRTKSQKLRGNITLHGYLKEPSPELIQFIIAAVIDDAPPGWLARMSLLIALLAGWKWLNVAPPPTTKCDATIQTDYEEEIHPVQNDGCHSSGSSDGCLPPESDTKPVQEKIDIAMQTERDENKDDIDGECIPLPLHRRTIISGYNERDTMPEISIDMLYRAIFRKTTLDKQIGHLPWGRFDCARGLSSEQVCILDDGSILLTCTHGCARFIIHKNSQHLDLEELAREHESGQIKSDVVFILHCVDKSSEDDKEDELRQKLAAVKPAMRSIVLLYVIERAMFGWSIGRALHDANKLTVPSNTSLDYLHEALADFMCEKFAWIAINLKALNDAREIGIGFDRCSFYMEIQDQVPGLKIDIYDGKLSSNLLPRSTKKFAQVKVFDTMDKFMSNEQKISRYQENGIPIIVVILQGKHGKLNQVSIAIFNDTRLKKDSPEKRLFDAISTKVLTDSVGKGYAEGWRSCDLSW